MAVVLLTTIAWIYSIAASLVAILTPIFLRMSPDITADLAIVFVSDCAAACPDTSLSSATDSAPENEIEDEARPLVSSPTPFTARSPPDGLRNRRCYNSARAETQSAQLAAEGLWTFLKKKRLRALGLVASTLCNTALLALSLDFVFRPYFKEVNHDLTMARMGAVGPDFARIFARSPNEHTIRLECRELSGDTWQQTEAVTVSSDTDFTTVLQCNGLSPETVYQYRWVTDSGIPIFSATDEQHLRFKTAPVNGAAAKFTFASTSCVKPDFPYGTKGVRGFREVGKHDLSFMMFLGDLIYVDAPYIYGTDLDTYRWHYRYLYGKDDFRNTVRSLPFMTIYDDHEILNDWHDQGKAPYPAAFRAFNEYAGSSNPHEDANRTAVFEYEFGDTAFFVMDTRGYRNWETDTMLGDKQKARLKDWLLRVNATHTVKFLVSSVPLTQNWRVGWKDTWAGFLKERQEILDFISRNGITNVLAISGDRHEVAITRLPGNVIEFSTSPIQAFYSPFDTYYQTADDEVIFTWRPGNIKWAKFTVDTTTNIPTVTYSLFVNDYQDEPVYEKVFTLVR
ncbi:PhoD-like phosphatase-domain-containing protein [Gaertneriomyces semiglobifer]|nr:PhoD-like phosphatase-domain-containing protein [Gaertneriomyces semiglobifer]